MLLILNEETIDLFSALKSRELMFKTQMLDQLNRSIE